MCTKLRVFSLPDTNGVRHFLLKSIFFIFSFLDDHLKKHYFYTFFAFSILFLSFLFLLQQHKIDKIKNAIFFSKTSFWHPDNFVKTLFWHKLTLFVFLKHAPKNYKMGKAVKNGPVFNTTLGPVLISKTPKSWTSFNSTACIYIYIHIYVYMCVC